MQRVFSRLASRILRLLAILAILLGIFGGPILAVVGGIFLLHALNAPIVALPLGDEILVLPLFSKTTWYAARASSGAWVGVCLEARGFVGGPVAYCLWQADQRAGESGRLEPEVRQRVRRARALLRGGGGWELRGIEERRIVWWHLSGLVFERKLARGPGHESVWVGEISQREAVMQVVLRSGPE